jgi:hypothetical protein
MPSASRGRATMAVRAANLAAVDLGVDRLETRPVPGKACDVRDLGADVIELEDERITLAAVDARASREDRAEVSEVAGDACAWVRAPCELRGVRTPPPRAPRGAPPMAAGADNLTSGDLCVDVPERDAVRDQGGDARGLLTDVVELQHHRIAFAAVDARVSVQILEHVGAGYADARALGALGLIAVQVSACAEIGGEACPAPPLVPVAEAVEGLERELEAAAAAAPQPTRPPDPESANGQRVGWSRRRLWYRDGRNDVPHPDIHRRLRNAELARDTRDRPAEFASQPPCLLPFRILAPHEHMFASCSDVTCDLD